MTAPTPSQTVAIADGAYRLSGKRVGLVFRKISGFGYLTAGEGAPAGELQMATRDRRINIDWLSNPSIAMPPGPGGRPVQAGVNQAWESIVPDRHEMLRGRNPSRIHCVGHSLGGALAAQKADCFAAGAAAELVLHAFGLPRAGDGLFARALTRSLSPHKTFRVSRPADPAPMIPLFTFGHLPFGQDGRPIAKTSDTLVSVAAHSTKNSCGAGPAADDSRRVERWLENAAAGPGRLAMGSASLLAMNGRALKSLLARAAKLAQDFGIPLMTLIGSICRLPDCTASGMADVSVAFVRWVLELLFQLLRSVAQRALSLVS